MLVHELAHRLVCSEPTVGVLSGAEIAVTNQNTNVTINMTTGGNGHYIAPQLAPGVYKVTVKKSGFKTSTIAEIKLDVQQIRAVDVTLDVGQMTETVSVSASGATALETTSTTMAQTIENKRIVDLPLNGRNPFGLATLVPGVIPGGGATPWISGGRNASSDITVDGTTIILPENNTGITQLGYRPIVDSIEEFTIITNSLAAEYGRTGGGVINVSTRSGTNGLHFTLFEFLRNNNLEA